MLQPRTFRVSVPPKNPERLGFPREAEIEAGSLLELVEQSPLRLTTLVKLLGINVRTIKSHLEAPGKLRVDEIITLAQQLGLEVSDLFEFIRSEAAEQAAVRAKQEAADAALKASNLEAKAKAKPKAKASAKKASGKKGGAKDTTRSTKTKQQDQA